MESRGLRFVLAASSPVKLRRGGVNLLGGRARTRALFPFVSAEVPDWDLLRAINVGGIPSIYLSPDPVEDLRAYCGNYLQIEIQGGRDWCAASEPFSRFLTAAAACRGQPIVFERLASDAAGVPARTVREYFQVLEDTLLATLLRPFRPGGARRKPVSHAKLYFFDVGVANALADVTHIAAGSPTFGPALEQLVFCELQAWLAYARDPRPLTFWRTADGSEVDFVVGDSSAIEVKATGAVANRDLTGLRRLAEETPLKHRIVVCRESAARVIDGLRVFAGDGFPARALERRTPRRLTHRDAGDVRTTRIHRRTAESRLRARDPPAPSRRCRCPRVRVVRAAVAPPGCVPATARFRRSHLRPAGERPGRTAGRLRRPARAPSHAEQE